MERKWIIGCIILLLVIAGGIIAYEFGIQSKSNKIYVVTTSSDIADIAKAVGGEKIEVQNIVPPAQCPGHFDIKPETMETLKKAKLFLRHDYDSQKFSDKLVKSSGNTNVTIVTVGMMNATFMTPPMRIVGIDNVTNALIKIDPKNANYYKQRAEALKLETKKIAAKQKKRLNQYGANKTKVIVALYQTGFAKWAGFEIVAVYPPDIPMGKVKQLIERGRQEGAELVIDNLQSPDKAAANAISKELNIPMVTLSNYPGGMEGTSTWKDSFIKNVDLIIMQLQKIHKKH